VFDRINKEILVWLAVRLVNAPYQQAYVCFGAIPPKHEPE
jgi:hypothetical protein